MGKKRSHGAIFLNGLFILVLLILVGILSGLIMAPLFALVIVLQGGIGGFGIVAIVAFVVSVYLLGMIFSRVKVSKK